MEMIQGYVNSLMDGFLDDLKSVKNKSLSKFIEKLNSGTTFTRIKKSCGGN